MSTFDQVLPIVREILDEHSHQLVKLGSVIINRDLNGRIRLVLSNTLADNPETESAITALVQALSSRLGPHCFPPENMVLFEPSLEAVLHNAPRYNLEGLSDVIVVDRLATETDWSDIAPASTLGPRIVFFSIKGGVGRSTALAVAAWSLAQAGKRVMVLDLDLESPGLSSSLLPGEIRPAYGITDWLVEDLLDNTASVFEDMVAISSLSHDGEILVVPAHGNNPGEYVAKLGRVWMSKVKEDGSYERWSCRLNRLLDQLQERWRPDVILIDCRAGIDEIASACITDLGAQSILLFALDSEQTWEGYRILFQHWRRTGVVLDIRERLQLVGAMIPEIEGVNYRDELCEHAWNLFMEEIYDEIPAGETTGDRFSYDQFDEYAPHFPWAIKWHRGFAAVRSIHSRFQQIDLNEVNTIFGPLVHGLQTISETEGPL